MVNKIYERSLYGGRERVLRGEGITGEGVIRDEGGVIQEGGNNAGGRGNTGGGKGNMG